MGIEFFCVIPVGFTDKTTKTRIQIGENTQIMKMIPKSLAHVPVLFLESLPLS